jgi:hypothetical protein
VFQELRLLRPGLDPASLLDLSPDRRASVLTGAALEASHTARLRLGAGPSLAPLDPATRAAFEHLLDQVARLSAEVETLSQTQEAARRSREVRLRLDPLRAIPADRVAAALGGTPEQEVPAQFALDAAAPEFNGTGWYAAEVSPGGSLRWSGAARCASLLLPPLGGGRLRLALSLRVPYGTALDLGQHDLFLDGLPLALRPVSGGAQSGVFEAEVELPPLGAGSRCVLLLHGEQWEDPSTGPRRDPRRLGLGLAWLRLERMEG